MNQLNVNQQQTILTLHQQGWSKRRIARELGLDRATVRKYLAEADSKSPTPQAGSAESPPAKSPTNPQTGSSSGSGTRPARGDLTCGDLVSSLPSPQEPRSEEH